jgi:hypothetical protein
MLYCNKFLNIKCIPKVNFHNTPKIYNIWNTFLFQKLNETLQLPLKNLTSNLKENMAGTQRRLSHRLLWVVQPIVTPKSEYDLIWLFAMNSNSNMIFFQTLHFRLLILYQLLHNSRACFQWTFVDIPETSPLGLLLLSRERTWDSGVYYGCKIHHNNIMAVKSQLFANVTRK